MIKQIRDIILNDITAIIYSFAVTGGMYTALVELHNNSNVSLFVIFSILVFTIYLVELLINWVSKSSKVEINFDLEDDVNELNHLFHKILLPITFYITLIGFGYYNITNHSLIIMLIIIFITFFILFVNIRAFFQHKLTLEHKTHYIYDIIKFLIFFNSINIISNLIHNRPDLIVIYSVLTLIISFFILLLMLWRYKHLHLKSLVLSLIGSIFIAIIFFLLHKDRIINSLQISLAILFTFYLAAAIIYHVLVKTLTRGVLIEYLIVIILVLTITYGIS